MEVRDSIDYKAKFTSQAYTYATGEKPSTIDDTWNYLTRTSVISSGTSYMRWVDFRGEIRSVFPDKVGGVRPCVNLSSNTKVSTTADEDGCYTVLFNTAPIISGENGDLGIKNNYFSETDGFPDKVGFAQAYTIDDADGDDDTITVKEYLDNVEIRSYVATLGAENTFDVTGKTWVKLANGNHTLKIVATDGFDEVSRIYTFVKSVGILAVQRTTPIESSIKPTNIVVSVVRNVPYNAKMKVEVCNNGFDAKPTWETIVEGVASELPSGLTHVFSNTTKTAGQWGVNIRVTVDRNGSEGACYITEIGGNFE